MTSNKKTVWILGAGASIGHSQGKMPGINNLLSKGLELKLIKKDLNSEPLKKYIRDRFDKDLFNTKEIIDIEYLLTSLSIDIEKSNNSSDSIVLKDYVINLIIKILNSISTELSNSKTSNEYDLFLSEISTWDTIITFNWDTILDNLLNREIIIDYLYNPHQGEPSKDPKIGNNNQYNNFIEDISSYGENSYIRSGVNFPRESYDGTKGTYLKLHGSADWYYCQNPYCTAHNKVFPILENSNKIICGECYNTLTNLIIPPVLNKQYNKYPFIDKLWKIAEEEIKLTTELNI